VWQTQSQSAGRFISTAASQWEMVVMKHRGRTSFAVRGPSTTAQLVDFPGEAEFFGMVFKLGTFMPHLPTVERLNRNDVTLPEAAGQSFWLNSATWPLPNYDNADTFISRLVREGLLAHDPIVPAVLENQQPAISVRALQYRFVRATGLTGKTVQQIERARRAQALLEQGTPILDAVTDTGYFDQAHMTNALKRFMGQTPAQIARDSLP
jgi:AraC-like DNA-binding protein